jgi:hypothetical protein
VRAVVIRSERRRVLHHVCRPPLAVTANTNSLQITAELL